MSVRWAPARSNPTKAAMSSMEGEPGLARGCKKRNPLPQVRAMLRTSAVHSANRVAMLCALDSGRMHTVRSRTGPRDPIDVLSVPERWRECA